MIPTAGTARRLIAGHPVLVFYYLLFLALLAYDVATHDWVGTGISVLALVSGYFLDMRRDLTVASRAQADALRRYMAALPQGDWVCPPEAAVQMWVRSRRPLVTKTWELYVHDAAGMTDAARDLVVGNAVSTVGGTAYELDGRALMALPVAWEVRRGENGRPEMLPLKNPGLRGTLLQRHHRRHPTAEETQALIAQLAEAVAWSRNST